jgi:hypothetical protein
MVTEKDCIEAIEGYPPHVVELMLDEQERQGNPRNVAVFQRKADANYFEGGFTWSKSVQGPMFWSSIHNGHMFDIAIPKMRSNSKEVALTIDEAIPKETVQEDNGLVPGATVLVEMDNGRGKAAKKKKIISVIETDKGPMYLCITETLFDKLVSEEGNANGISSHLTGIKLYKPTPKVRLTLKDISDGKGVGVPPELIEIVN